MNVSVCFSLMKTRKKLLTDLAVKCGALSLLLRTKPSLLMYLIRISAQEDVKNSNILPFFTISSPPHTLSDKNWSDVVQSHYFKRLQSAQIHHCIWLRNATPAWNSLIRQSATCRLSSHLPAHRCHIPAQHNCANRHLHPNQRWQKGQRPRQRPESNGQDESHRVADEG